MSRGAAGDALLDRLRTLHRRARGREFAVTGLYAVPWWAFACALGAALGTELGPTVGAGAALAAAGLVAAAVLAHAWRIVRARDTRWFVRRLQAELPWLDDSLDLLLRPPPSPSALETLQQQRLRARLQAQAWPDLRAPWPWPRLLANAVVAAGCVGLLAAPPWTEVRQRFTAAPASGLAVTAGGVDIRLAVEPPRYTGRRAFEQAGAEAQLPAGSRVRWRLRFGTAPAQAELVFHDGSRLALRRRGEDWLGERVLEAATLYRVDAAGSGIDAQRLYRLDVVPDRAPEIVVRAPDRTLNLLDDGQVQWALSFEARDDYGLGQAELSITLAQGSGEQIEVREQTRQLNGEGGARERRYRETLDLRQLGFAEGDDLIVRLSVADNAEPAPHRSRSASFILRWPPELSAESEGLDGLARRAMPAVFRSQRQIILDTEALIAERPQLTEREFARRADALGVDQKLLRLRYGQFLGEEAEGGGLAHHHDAGAAGPGPEPGQADPLAQAREPGQASGPVPGRTPDQTPDRAPRTAPGPESGAVAAPGQGHAPQPARVPEDEHEHDEAAAGATAPGGDDQAVMAEFGHIHDIKEAATLLDEPTKALLRRALDAMWEAEGHLRVGDTGRALAPEHRALEAIKQVQQSTRIYLARLGLELPPIDPARRLTGDRRGLVAPAANPVAANDDDTAVVAAAWQTLTAGGVPEVETLRRWVESQPASADAGGLALLHAADALRRDPGCASCRLELQARLWPWLPTATTALRLRREPDAEARAYAQHLDRGAR